MIAYAVRLAATGLVLVSFALIAMLSGWVLIAPERPGFGRHKVVDWACPVCDLWSVAFVSRWWRKRAIRRALGLAHRRLSPNCPASDPDLMILSLPGGNETVEPKSEEGNNASGPDGPRERGAI